jgi:sugar phosphate isomerase/epimerase
MAASIRCQFRSLRRIAAALCMVAAGTVIAARDSSVLWRRENLVAWCIVPFDAKQRDATERAAMLKRLELRQLAYDWRAEHVASFDEEVTVMAQHGIDIVAWWFPGKLDDNARTILDLIARRGIRPQLWVSGGGAAIPGGDESGQRARIGTEVARLRPIVEAAKRVGCKVGLYNHGGWFGEPENQLAVLGQLRAEGFSNVGLVYNFHHGHGHIARFATMWPRIQSEVLAVNLNGMTIDGDKRGQKIAYLGEGDQELAMMRVIQASGWRGLVGILNHRADVDAEVALRRNLEGLASLTESLNGRR